MSIDQTRTDSLDDALAWRITRAARLLRIHLSQVLRPLGVSPEQFYLLFRLHESDEGCTQAGLVDSSLGDRPNVSRQLGSMERLGWIERRTDPDDRRSKRVVLTPAGREITDQLLALAVEERLRLFGGLSPQALDGLYQALSQLESQLALPG